MSVTQQKKTILSAPVVSEGEPAYACVAVPSAN